MEVINQFISLLLFIVTIIGKIKAISTSKIKKIIVIKKNRREKGSRDDVFGSKPHSNGDDFSRSEKVFFDRNEAKIITIDEIIIIIIVINKIENIIFTKIISLFNWKSNVLIYYKNN